MVFLQRLSVCVPAPVSRSPGSASGTCFAGPHSPWSPPLAPPAPPRIAPLCSLASRLLWRRPTSRARASSATAPRLPDADRRTLTQAPNGRARDIPGSDTILVRVMWPSTPAGRQCLAYRHRSCCVRPWRRSPLLRKAHFVAQSHTPRTRCVRFVPGIAAAHATLATGRLARPYPGRTCTGRSRQLRLAHLHAGYAARGAAPRHGTERGRAIEAQVRRSLSPPFCRGRGRWSAVSGSSILSNEKAIEGGPGAR
jgi:hypothetical protein